MIATTLALTLGLQAAHADEKAAEECVQTKVWEAYAEGWGVRTLTGTTLQPGKTRNYLVTLYAGNEYEIKTCGDDSVKNLDVLLYDTDGNVVMRDEVDGRQPAIKYTPKDTDTYYVVLYLRSTADAKADAGVAMAVVYK